MDGESYLRFVLALILVIGLILALSWAVRRFGLGGAVPRNRGPRRLAVIEITALDAKRRLVLIKRDGTEHLLLVGGAVDQVIERNIAPIAFDPKRFSEPLAEPLASPS